MTVERKNRIFELAIFIVTITWFSVFAVARIDMHHDAIMLKPAIDVAAGKALFRDTFCQYGALAVWLQALAVKVFGGEIVVTQLLTVLFYGGIGVLIDVIFRRFLSFPFRLVNLGLFWGMAYFYMVPMHPWSSVYALFFMLLSTEFLLRFIARERWREAFFSGLFAGLAFLARHPCGVVIAVAGALTLALGAWRLKRSWRGLGWFCAGGAAVLALFALYLTVAGAWSAYLRQCFGFVFSFAVERGGNLQWSEISKRFFPINEVLGPIDLIFSVMPLLCVAVALKAFLALSNGKAETGQRKLEYFAVALAGVVSWHQYYPVACLRHLYWAGIPMFGVFALVAEHLWRSRSRVVACRAAAVLLLLLGAIPVYFRAYWGTRVVLKHYPRRRTIDIPGCRGLQLSVTEWNMLYAMNAAYQALPGEIRARGVFNYTPDAVVSVMFPETKFRHPMFVNWKNSVYPDYPQLALDYILEHRPILASQEPLALPGYQLIFQGELYGLGYWLYAPLY